MTIRRILVAVDASPASLAAAEAAAELAALTGAELAGLFVEDLSLLALAGSPLAREVDLFTGAPHELDSFELERQLRRQAERAEREFSAIAGRRGVCCSFRVARGRVPDEVAEAARGVDLVSIGVVGWTARGRSRVGATARALLGRRDGTTLLLPRAAALHDRPTVIFGDVPNARRALALGCTLATRVVRPLHVLLAGEDAATAGRLLDVALAGIDEAPREITRRAIGGGEGAARAIRSRHRGLLIAPLGLPGLELETLEPLLAGAAGPTLLVG